MLLTKEAFGKDFIWGVSTAAYQIEGAHNLMVKAHLYGINLYRKEIKYSAIIQAISHVTITTAI